MNSFEFVFENGDVDPSVQQFMENVVIEDVRTLDGSTGDNPFMITIKTESLGENSIWSNADIESTEPLLLNSSVAGFDHCETFTLDAIRDDQHPCEEVEICSTDTGTILLQDIKSEEIEVMGNSKESVLEWSTAEENSESKLLLSDGNYFFLPKYDTNKVISCQNIEITDPLQDSIDPNISWEDKRLTLNSSKNVYNQSRPSSPKVKVVIVSLHPMLKKQRVRQAQYDSENPIQFPRIPYLPISTKMPKPFSFDWIVCKLYKYEGRTINHKSTFPMTGLGPNRNKKLGKAKFMNLLYRTILNFYGCDHSSVVKVDDRRFRALNGPHIDLYFGDELPFKSTKMQNNHPTVIVHDINRKKLHMFQIDYLVKEPKFKRRRRK